MAAAAAAGFLFRLVLVTSLVFSLNVFSNAVPVTRIGGLMNGAQVNQFPENWNLELTDDSKMMNKRMAAELNDYPGSGANNHHTPRP